jgi:hypothetical protein
MYIKGFSTVIYRQNLVIPSDAGKLMMLPNSLTGVNDTDETELNHTKNRNRIVCSIFIVIGDQFVSGIEDGYDQLSGRLIRNKT